MNQTIETDKQSDQGDLPEGWISCAGADLFQWSSGKFLPKTRQQHGNVPVYGGNGIAGFHNRALVTVRTLVIGRVGALCGNVYATYGPAWVTDNAIFAASIPDDVALDYVRLVFSQAGLTSRAGGSGQPFVNQEVLNSVQIPLPPRCEQDRIVQRFNQLDGTIHKTLERLTKVATILAAFRQSVLNAACSGRLTEDWRERHTNIESTATTIGKLMEANKATRIRRGVPDSVPRPELVDSWQLPDTWGCYAACELLRCGAFVDLKDGNHGANHPKVMEFTDAGIPFITAAQVNNFRIDYDSAYKLSGEPLERIRVGFAKAGDVIYTHKGSVGRVAIADRDCILTPQTTYYRLSPKVFVSDFLMYYLASQAFVEQVNLIKGQTTRDFVPISEQYLLFHRVPPMPEQFEIVRRVEALFKLAHKIEERLSAATNRTNKLTQSILAKAFRGELVPTEAELARQESREYEPASVLLARIVDEREKTSASTHEGGRRNMRNHNTSSRQS